MLMGIGYAARRLLRSTPFSGTSWHPGPRRFGIEVVGFGVGFLFQILETESPS